MSTGTLDLPSGPLQRCGVLDVHRVAGAAEPPGHAEPAAKLLDLGRVPIERLHVVRREVHRVGRAVRAGSGRRRHAPPSAPLLVLLLALRELLPWAAVCFGTNGADHEDLWPSHRYPT